MSIVAREYFNNQPISLLEHNGDIYFHALSIAKALNYQQPKYGVRNFVSRRFEEIKNCAVFVEPLGQANFRVSALAAVAITSSNAGSVFLNFEALSLFIDYSQAPNASKLKRQMAKCVHQTFQKEQQQMKLYQANDSLAILESLNQQFTYTIEILKQQEKRIKTLEFANRLHNIDRHQCAEIQKRIKELAFKIAELENKPSPGREHFIKLWTNFNNRFNIPSYKDLARADYTKALDLLDAWEAKLDEELRN